MINDMLKKCSWCTSDLGLLILRIGVGLTFITTGWMKVSDIQNTVMFFGQLGLPAFIAYAGSYTELIGGVLLVFGIYTRIVSILISIIMVGAIYFSYRDLPSVMLPGLLLSNTLALLLSGGGKHSSARHLCGCGNCSMCKGSDIQPKQDMSM